MATKKPTKKPTKKTLYRAFDIYLADWVYRYSSSDINVRKLLRDEIISRIGKWKVSRVERRVILDGKEVWVLTDISI